MENRIISQQNAIYVLNTNYHHGSPDMMNFFMTPAAIHTDSTNMMKNMTSSSSSNSKTTSVQIKIPQGGVVVEHNKESFNDKTKKSLLKINLFIKRLKWFNIFADTTKEQQNIQQYSSTMDTIRRASEVPHSHLTTTTKTLIPTITKTTTTATKEVKLNETNQNQRKCSRLSVGSRKYMSTKEMYREAAKLLGINCSLSSSCRCYECQSHYFDCYADSTDQTDDLTDSDDDDDEDDEACDSDCESISSEVNDPDHYITNCYLIHTEELCECCQMHNEHKKISSTIQQPPPVTSTLSYTDIVCNDVNFNAPIMFLS